MTSIANRAHIFARPSAKERFVDCFSVVLGCGAPAILQLPNGAEPILAFRFPGGGSLSVEFSEDALDEQAARRGAWLELRSNSVAQLTQRILDAGFPQLRHSASDRFYFAAPGGQVFGLVADEVVPIN